MEIKTEEVTSIKPVTDEKQERHLYQKTKQEKNTKKEKEKKAKIYYEDKGKIIDIYA